ncbi:MAG TPA: competence protein CoiA family protein [Parachlamydiaceae bacterium]|nr:competence protein CoiA family protein [Parachlamydiaceae bacterium]
MQICAHDLASTLIFADNANKHQDYQCVECRQTVRLRRGIHRKAHFYHIQPNRICKQHAKGMPHLMLQQFLQNILPEGEAELECAFASIKRIADVVWHPQKIVYEIQCSPISAEEIKARNQNYTSVGYQVVWIFHDERYNQHRLSAAENSIIDQPHYYSDMNEMGEGKIYDQFSIIANGKRVQRLPILPIDLSTPKLLNEGRLKWQKKLPCILQRRAKNWPLVFSGDTIDSTLNPDESLINHSDNQRELALILKDLFAKNNKLSFIYLLKQPKIFFREWIARPYSAVIKLILERACR